MDKYGSVQPERDQPWPSLLPPWTDSLWSPPPPACPARDTIPLTVDPTQMRNAPLQRSLTIFHPIFFAKFGLL